MPRLRKPLVVVALFAVLTITGWAQTPKIGERAKTFRLPSARGAEVALADYAGKSPVVLVFYRGSW